MVETTPERLFERLEPHKNWPINRWSPSEEADIGLSIDRAGRWYCQRSEITRVRMLKFFASLLSCRDDCHYLITPQVKYRVWVEECPLLAVDFETTGQGETQCVFLRTNMDDTIRAGKRHPLCFQSDPDTGHVLPTVQVREGLLAKLTRAVYYRLADLAVPAVPEDQTGTPVLHIWSDGEQFQIA